MKHQTSIVAVTAVAASIALTGLCLARTAPVAPPDPSNRPQLTVAEGTDIRITLHDYESVAMTQSPALRTSLRTDRDARMSLLDKLINTRVLAAEAARKGYDADPEVLTVRKNRLATLMQTRISEQSGAREPGEEDLRRYYDEHIDEFRRPEAVRVRHILVGSPDRARSLLAEMKKEKLTQYRFRKLAQEHSEDPDTKNRGGDLSFLSKDGRRGPDEEPVDMRIAKAAFALRNNGDISREPVETAKGWHILMRTGHRSPVNLSFENARTRIGSLVARDLHEKKVQETIDALSLTHGVELFEENLKYVVIDLSQESTPEDIRPSKGPARRR